MADKTEIPFNVNWLDSSYFESLLPSTPWQNIYDILCPELATAIREQFKVPQRKQILIELLGPHFKRSYLSEESDDPLILVRNIFNLDIYLALSNKIKESTSHA